MAVGAEEQMRAGIRARVAGGFWKMSPYAVLAVLCASALGPVVAAGAGGAAVAGLGLAAGVGTNLLSEMVGRSVEAMRRRGREPSGPEVESELAGRLTAALEGVDAAGLRAEIAAVLREIGAAGVALEAAVESGDQAIQRQITSAFAELGEELDEFRFLITGVGEKAAEIQEILHRQDAERRFDRDRMREQSMQLTLIREDLAVIGRRRRGERAGPRAVREGCPYRGLLPFQEDHAEVFHGRELMTAKLLGKVAERLGRPSLVTVTGASGAGKSSLIRAGLLPGLAKGLLPGSGRWASIVVTPGRDPLEELAAHLSALGGTDAATLARSLAGDPGRAHLAVRQAVLARGADRLVIVVDQFEEIFTLGGDAGRREAFVTALAAAASVPPEDPGALVVLAVRGDYVDRCAAHPVLVEALQEGQFVVGPMTGDELRRAVTGPAAAAGLKIENGLAETVLAELGTEGRAAGVLPLLSQAMLLTWENREGDLLTLRGYGRAGGVRHAVQSSADAVYDALPAHRQAVAREVFQRMTVVSGDGRATRRPVARDDLYGHAAPGRRADVDAVLEAFTAKRLLVLGDRVAEIAHDALLHAWPRLRGWLQEDQAGQILYHQFLDDARDWADHGRDPSFLYRGTRLAAVRQERERWAAAPENYPPPAAVPSEFLGMSERAEVQRQRNRWLTVVALVLALVVSLAGTLVATNAAGRAGAESLRALSRQLASDSAWVGAFDPAASQLLAVAAWRTAPTAEARLSLLNALASPARGALTGHTGAVNGIVFGPDGRTLASTAQDGTVRLWDTAARRPLGRPMVSRSGTGYDLAFSPDGRMLATAGLPHIQLWDTATQRPLGEPLSGHADAVYEVAFSPDGRTLVSGGNDGTARLWDPVTRRPIGKPLTGHKGGVHPFFSPDGGVLATYGDEDTIRLWRMPYGRPIGRPLNGHTDAIQQLAFSPDGRLMATAGNDTTIRLWDTATGRPSGTPLAGHGAAVYQMAFSPDGRTLVSADSEGVIRLWDPAARRLIGEPSIGHTGAVHAMAISPDGATLATSGVDHTIRLWEMSTGRSVSRPLVGHTGPVNRVVFGRDGTLASTGEDRTIRLWKVATGRRVGEPATGYLGTVQAVGFKDGRLLTAEESGAVESWDLATGRSSGRITLGAGALPSGFDATGTVVVTLGGSQLSEIRLWDTATGRPIGPPMTGHRGTVIQVVLSPDRKLVASRGDDNTVRVWDTATGRPVNPRVPYIAGASDPIAFGPDGRTLAGGGRVSLVDARSGWRRAGPLIGAGGAPAPQIAFNRTGTRLAAGQEDGTVRLWDPATGRAVGPPLTGHTGTVNHLAFSPDGSRLASAGEDDVVRLWDAVNGRAVGQPLIGHTEPVWQVAFSPDGSLLASGAADGTVRLWDVATGRPVGEPRVGHTDAVYRLLFSPDGTTLAGVGNGIASTWDVAVPADPAAAVCAIAGRTFTPQEWTHYLRDEPYRKIC
ncbi:nSTAND1 domain-containing NTPase [Sphaerisporangium aureirubrum]|uniref:AAA family ATPase n=1 Tax=Sphaerisporangium aureirubrum TaxID=1544736 RepID=A0ABW1NSK7_9ACTN